jgi:hypothetical protein
METCRVNYPAHPTSYRDVKKPSISCRLRHRWGPPIHQHVICMDCLRRFPVDVERLAPHSPFSPQTEREIEHELQRIRRKELR